PTATTYPSPPQPGPSGSTEYLTLTGLTPGQRYFVAIKAVDNDGNQSSLSNVPSTQAFQQGKVDVSTPLAVGYTTSDHALLSLPGYRGGRNGDTLIIVSSQFGSDQTGWIVSYDRGEIWHDVRARWMTMHDGTATWYSHSHSGAAFAGGLHIGFRGYASSDPSGYRYIKSPYTSEADMETVRFPDAPLNGYYPIVVANSANDVWFFDISESSNRDNLRYWHSTDRFATPVAPRRVCSIPEDPQNYWRMGVIMDANGYPRVSIFRFRGGFSIWSYNPTTQTFDSTLVVSADIGGLGRSYAQAEVNGLDHIVYTGGTTGDLVHFYETGAGHFDSTIVSSSNVDVYAPQLCAYGDGPSAKLYVAYVDHDTSVCVKGWTASAGWDADSIVVTGPGQAALDPALVPQIPSSWGFLPVWYQNVHNDSLYFVKVNLSSPSASPGGGIASVTVDRSPELLDSLARVDSANAKAESAGALLPREYKLSQNYPNPFNPTTTIEYDLPKDSRVLLTVTNILGQTVSTLVDRNQPAGRYRVEWDGKDADGREAATGIYLCHLTANDYQQTTKMVLLR
ncbi:MAG TPA: FlgD immunoglobulin-like domain containing protein, partial [candidate division Zixibacteria bacterium]|nr:FlgD immunoglobulin-like domain containing protein [candidate division Zixibacteria bacterium]